MFGLAAAKVFLGKLPWKLIGIVGAAIALMFLVYRTVDTVKDWGDGLFERGYAAGHDAAVKSWQTSNARAASEALEKVVANNRRSNDAVLAYVGDIAARKPEVIRIEERINELEKSSDASLVCYNDVGLQIINDNRRAVGYPETASAVAPAGAVHGAVPGEQPAQGDGDRR